MACGRRGAQHYVRGVTLIELLVVMLIVVYLSSANFGKYLNTASVSNVDNSVLLTTRDGTISFFEAARYLAMMYKQRTAVIFYCGSSSLSDADLISEASSGMTALNINSCAMGLGKLALIVFPVGGYPWVEKRYDISNFRANGRRVTRFTADGYLDYNEVRGSLTQERPPMSEAFCPISGCFFDLNDHTTYGQDDRSFSFPVHYILLRSASGDLKECFLLTFSLATMNICSCRNSYQFIC